MSLTKNSSLVIVRLQSWIPLNHPFSARKAILPVEESQVTVLDTVEPSLLGEEGHITCGRKSGYSLGYR